MVDWSDLIGKSFSYGGRGPSEYDCYGLVIEMHRRAGQVIPDFISPRTDEEIAEVMTTKKPLWTRCAAAPGVTASIRLGRLITHVSYVIDHDRMIHVWQRSGGVCVEPLSAWKLQVEGFYKYTHD